MIALFDAIRNRLLPALVTALGVALITAGLLSYADPATAGTAASETPVVETLAPGDGPSATLELPSPSTTASGQPGSSPDASLAPAGHAAVTRVVVPALRIDLPVISGNDGYPYCNVAMYIDGLDPPLLNLGIPGRGVATYIYAHARDGMFGPIYQLAIQQHNAKKMLGMIVQVYTDDDRLYLYEIREYRLHALNLDAAMAATSEELWLQTSEGPKGTPGKTQLRALLLSVGQADPADAHPRAKPIACG